MSDVIYKVVRVPAGYAEHGKYAVYSSTKYANDDTHDVMVMFNNHETHEFETTWTTEAEAKEVANYFQSNYDFYDVVSKVPGVKYGPHPDLDDEVNNDYS